MNKKKRNSAPRYALVECEALMLALPIVFVFGFWLGTLVKYL